MAVCTIVMAMEAVRSLWSSNWAAAGAGSAKAQIKAQIKPQVEVMAMAEGRGELTRLCVRATRRAGYDEAFIDRAMPALTITLPLISAGCVLVAQDSSREIVGVVAVTTTPLQGIALLYAIFVDPAHWRR